MKKMNTSPQLQSFSGFTLPDGAWLPPELIYILPFLSQTQLKITIVVIYHHNQVAGSEPLTLNDIQSLSGIIGRSSVTGALKWLLGENSHGLQVLERQKIGRSFTYFPRLNMSPKIVPMNSQESENQTQDRKKDSKDLKDIKELNYLSDSLVDPNTEKMTLETRVALLKKLRASGIFLKTANDLLDNHTADEIEQQFKYFQYALEKGFAQGPGWLVFAIKENWPAPLGYKEPTTPTDYADDAWVCLDCEKYPCECPDVELPEIKQSPRCQVRWRNGNDEPSMIPVKAWESAVGQMKLDMPTAAFENNVRDLVLIDANPETAEFVVVAFDDDVKAWVDGRLSSLFNRLLTGIMNHNLTVRFVSLDELEMEGE